MNLVDYCNIFSGVVESVTDSNGKHYLDSRCLKVRVQVIHGPSTQTPTSAITNCRLSANMFEKCYNYSKRVDVYQKAEKVFPITSSEISDSSTISSSRLNGLRVVTNYSNQDTPVTSGHSLPQLIKKGDRVLVCAPDGDYTNLIIFDRI